MTPSLSLGGAESAMYRLILNSHSHSHTVICLNNVGPYEAMYQEIDVPVVVLNMKSNRVPILILIQLYREIKRIDPDVVQAWMYHGNLIGGVVARLAGVGRVIWGIRLSNPLNGQIKKSTRFVNHLSAKFGASVPDLIISCATKATYEHIKMGYPSRKFATIHNGYDTEILKYNEQDRDTYRNLWGVKFSTTVFGIVARWHPQKDHRTLIKALKKLSEIPCGDWKCVFIGTGLTEDNSDLMRLILDFDLEDKCILQGEMIDIKGVFSALDVNVLTSKDEGFPNVIAEAMACGVPCISTDVGDAKLIIADTGWVVPVGEPESIKEALIASTESKANQHEWLERKNQCRARIVDQFGIRRMVSKFEHVWTSGSIGE